jgi:hypothetical protein
MKQYLGNDDLVSQLSLGTKWHVWLFTQQMLKSMAGSTGQS